MTWRLYQKDHWSVSNSHKLYKSSIMSVFDLKIIFLPISLTKQFNPAQKTHFIKVDFKHVFIVIIILNVIFN